MSRYLLVLPLITLTFAAPAYAQLAAEFIGQWGAFGTANSQFNEPYGVAVDKSGNVYVSDTVNYRMQKFDANGNFILKWGSFGSAPGQFYDPVGLTVDDIGHVYVAEFSNDRVQKFDSLGVFVHMWGTTGSGPGEFRTADDVCLDSSRYVYVVDKNNHRVQKFENNGTYIGEWGGLGTGPGQFQYPVGIACDSFDKIYVAEQAGHRIQKFDNNGNFVAMWGSLGTGPGEFNEPIHIDIDDHDRLFVPDSKNHRIQVFDSDGNFIIQWGGQGTGPGQFNEPEGVGVDGNNIVYVADTQNHRIQKFELIPSCAPCPPLPLANTARFKFGAAVPLGGGTFALPLLASTPESINFSQMAVEYDDTCLSFVGASVGSDVSGAGGIYINESLGATDPSMNHRVLMNVTGTYGGDCDLEVFVLEFQSLGGGGASCRIVWDRDTPAGNPPNHINTTRSVQIRSPAITFCDFEGVEPRTTFRFGTPTWQPTCIEVPVLVTTDQSINFTQVTVEYASSCLVFQSAAVGSGVSNAGNPFAFDDAGATKPLLDRHVTVNGSGQYGPGTNIEVYRLCFQFAALAPGPCQLSWDESSPAGNPPNHLLTTVPSLIPPEFIRFIDGELLANCPSIDISGSVTYFSNGNDILPGGPDPTAEAVTIEDCHDGIPSTTADNANFTLPFGDGPLAQACICASRAQARCNRVEGGVLSGSDLIMLQDFVAQIGPPPTPRQLIAGDLNRDGMLLGNDELALKQWIGRGAVCSDNTCMGQATDNCAGTWQFIFPTGAGPGDFEHDLRCLDHVCTDQFVAIEGILLGDVDASWPNIFPTATMATALSKPSRVPLSLGIVGWDEDVVTLALNATIENGAALHHVIYSLEYDASMYEYLDARAGAESRDWGTFDNPALLGEVHGIVHRRAGMPPVTASGEVLTFRFRARGSGREASFWFSRLLANDFAAGQLSVVIGGREEDDRAVRGRYQLVIHPNPFTPSTQVRLTVPQIGGVVPVTLRVYDVSGRLVRSLLEGQRGPGVHEVMWNGADDRGTTVGAGIYLVHALAGDWSEVRRVVLIR